MLFAPTGNGQTPHEFTMIFSESAEIAKSFAEKHGWAGDFIPLDEAFPAFLRQATVGKNVNDLPHARHILHIELEKLGAYTIVFIQLTDGEISVIREIVQEVKGRSERLALFTNYLSDSRLSTLMLTILARRIAITLSDAEFYI